MKRRRILLLLALAAVAAGLVLFWPRGPKEPLFQGQRLGYLLHQSLAPGTPESQAQARAALNALGTNALPWLMSEFTRPFSKPRGAFNRWVQRNTKSEFRFRGDQVRVRHAAHGIYLLGSNAAPALATLYSYFTDPARGSQAAYAMAGAGELSIRYAQQAVASTNTDLVRLGALLLMQLARETESAIPHLIQLLNHKDSFVRNWAIYGLGAAKSRPDLTLPAIISAAADPDPRVRFSVTNLLHKVQFSNAKPAIPALRQLMTNSDPVIATVASNVLNRIDPVALPAGGP